MDEEGRLLSDKAALRRLTTRLREEGKTIVTINGCFDILHSGHVGILQEAARQGDILIVGLNSDASVRANKGEGRPILSQDQRAAILLALEPVDYVCVFEEIHCMAFIEAARPHVHVNDASYGENCVESETVRAVGARLHLAPKQEGVSTTTFINRMRRAQGQG